MKRFRFDFTDKEMTIIAPFLPTDVRGVPRIDDRRVLNGVLWCFRTGSPWADIPEPVLMQEGAFLLADKAFDNDAIRKVEDKRTGNIPAKSNRRKSFMFALALPL